MAERKPKRGTEPGEAPWSRAEIQEIRAKLLAHFDAEARELPWRGSADPYRILVSEVMSQQTRLETVVPYYRRWVERFPELTKLAEADEQEVLTLWQGLGYYSRARNLLAAAREVAARYGGRLPESYDELRTLPGVGPYTAGAVASIAFGRPVPAVDGNVRRVLARLLDDPDPSPATLRDRTGALVDPHRPGDFNQALMELGSSICTPRSPDCPRCPIRASCRGLATGRQEELPVRRSRGAVPHSRSRVLVVRVREEGETWYLLRRRPSTGLLAGMWEFPEEERVPFRIPGITGSFEADLPTRGAAALKPVEFKPVELEPVEHAFSHRRITYAARLVEVDPPPPPLPRADNDGVAPHLRMRWVARGELPDLPLPVAQRKILELARSVGGELPD